MIKKPFFTVVIFLIIIISGCDMLEEKIEESKHEEEKNIIYVSVAGNNSNPGTKSLPKRSIQNAVDSVTAPAEIHVSHGTYFDTIELTANLILSGGYQHGNWSIRDPKTYLTIINSTSDTATITCSSDTKVDGFTINGCTHPNGKGTAVKISGHRVTISNNIITGANTSTESFTIYSGTNMDSEILNNTITGGKASDNVTAIYLMNGYRLKISNNIITSSQSDNTSNDTYTIFIWNGTPLIENNTLTGGNGTNVYGIFEYTSSDPLSLINNTFSNYKSGLYKDDDANIIMTGINSAGNLTQNANGTGTVLSTPTGSGNSN